MTNLVSIGQFALTPQQLQSAGIIKPGTASLVQSLVDKGTTLANAMPPNIFTGKQGATDLQSFTNNITAQAGAVQTNLAKAQTSLTNAGVITGKESVTAIAGVVNSAATVGVSSTISAVKGAASAAGGINNAIKGGLTNATSSLIGGAQGRAAEALKAIGKGNLAGQMADSVTSGLGPIKDSLAGLASAKGLSSAVDQAKGVAASAFDAIKGSLPTLPAGVPIDAAKIAKDAAEKAEAASSTIAGAANNLTSGLSGVGNALKGAAQNAASGLQNQLSGGAAALGKALPSAGGALAGAASGLAGGAKSAVENAIGQVSGAATGLASKASSLQNLASAGSALGNDVLSQATAQIDKASTALNAVTGIQPTSAVSALSNVTGAVASAATSKISTAITSGVATMASGLSNLPGGASVAGAIQNNSKNLLSSAAGALPGAASGALGKLGSKAGALGGAAASLGGLAKGLADKATSALNGLKPPSLDPASLLSKAGLPSGLASQLASQISAIGSGGGVPVGMPVVAVNTTNRAEITAALDALLGTEPGIPKPNQLGEISPAATNTVESFEDERRKAMFKLADWAVETSKLSKKADKLEAKYIKAKNKLPQGDPSLTALYDEYVAANKAYLDDLQAYSKAYKEFEAKYG